ncbi:MAG: GGDEF domain-containing protein [Polaribacter sp.]|jgi:GGDEF domain-containing protein
MLLMSLFGFIFSNTVSEKYRLLEELAIEDGLTGAVNRRALMSKLDEIVAIGAGRNQVHVAE